MIIWVIWFWSEKNNLLHIISHNVMKLYIKSCPYELYTIFQVFWSHVHVLCEKPKYKSLLTSSFIALRFNCCCSEKMWRLHVFNNKKIIIINKNNSNLCLKQNEGECIMTELSKFVVVAKQLAHLSSYVCWSPVCVLVPPVGCRQKTFVFIPQT